MTSLTSLPNLSFPLLPSPFSPPVIGPTPPDGLLGPSLHTYTRGVSMTNTFVKVLLGLRNYPLPPFICTDVPPSVLIVKNRGSPTRTSGQDNLRVTHRLHRPQWPLSPAAKAAAMFTHGTSNTAAFEPLFSFSRLHVCDSDFIRNQTD